MSQFFKILVSVLVVVVISIIGCGAYFLVGMDRSSEKIEHEKATSFEFKEVPSSAKAIVPSQNSEEKKVVVENKTLTDSTQSVGSTTIPAAVKATSEICPSSEPEISEITAETVDFTSEIETIKGQYPDLEVFVVSPDGTEKQVQ